MLVDLLVSFMLWQRRAKMLYQHSIFVVKLCLAENFVSDLKVCSVEIKQRNFRIWVNSVKMKSAVLFTINFSFLYFLEIISLLEISTKIYFTFTGRALNSCGELWFNNEPASWRRLYWQLSRLSIDLPWNSWLVMRKKWSFAYKFHTLQF